MKKFAIILLMGGVLLSGCNYLDIVPDERNTPENTYQNPQAAKNYLYSCYSKMPDPRVSEALDKYSAAEIINVIEKSEWVTFPRGYYSPSSPQLTKGYYYNIWTGLHQCYQFLSVVDFTPDIEPDDLQYYKAEATLLIAYYHWLSFRAYGPSVIMRENIDPLTPIEELPERSSVDEVVQFIDEKITEAETIGLAEKHDGDDYGRFTKYVAEALRAKVHLYAASPLFNGNSDFFAGFKSPLDGRFLISQTVDIEKWKTAETVTRKAIADLENAGYRLYNEVGHDDAGTPSANKPGPVNKAQRAVRYTFMDNVGGTNPEVIMVDTRKEGTYALQNQSTPKQKASNGYKNSWGILAPTLQTVEMFYTKNGLPIDEDKEFDYSGRYKIVNMPVVIKQDTNIYDSIVTMFLSDVGSVFIIDENENLCGIVSRKDLLKATIGSADINKMPVGMVMTRTPNVITTNKEDDVVLAAKKIIEHEVDSIPVVEINEEDTNQIKVIGRLSKTNITKLFLEIADN